MYSGIYYEHIDVSYIAEFVITQILAYTYPYPRIVCMYCIPYSMYVQIKCLILRRKTG